MTITQFCRTLEAAKETSVTDRIYCQIRVKGHLSEQWVAWFEDLEIDNRPGGEAVLAGPLPDQAALYGVLNRMRDLGLALISLKCFEATPDETSRNPIEE
jgi:hypothetical protein